MDKLLQKLPENIIDKIKISFMSLEPHPLAKIVKDEGVLDFQKYREMFDVECGTLLLYKERLRRFKEYREYLADMTAIDIFDIEYTRLLHHLFVSESERYIFTTHLHMMGWEFYFNNEYYDSNHLDYYSDSEDDDDDDIDYGPHNDGDVEQN